jgi:hypothetical protein
MALAVSWTMTQTDAGGTVTPLPAELAAALAAPLEQFTQTLAWTFDEAGSADHAEREQHLTEAGREGQRRLLQASFDLDALREQRITSVTSVAGIRHGTADRGRTRGVSTVFGPVRVERLAYRNRREPDLYPADARWCLHTDPYSLGMRALTARHLAAGGYGDAQAAIKAQTGTELGRAQLTGLATEIAAWTGDFYELRARDAAPAPDSDVLMMQADGKGIAMLPAHRKTHGATDATHPGIKRLAEVVAVADLTPAVRCPEDIAAPPARRAANPGPKARDKWVAASVTDDIPAMIRSAFDEADRRDPAGTRQRIFLADGNKQQITAAQAEARARGQDVPVLIDFIHASGYLGKAGAQLHPADPVAATQWADGQRLRLLHGRAPAVAATLKAQAAGQPPGQRDDIDKAATYIGGNSACMHYDKALAAGWPIATGVIEGACRYVIEDRFGITGARWTLHGAETILKLRALVVNGDLEEYLDYYKNRYRQETHLNRYDPASLTELGLAA